MCLQQFQVVTTCQNDSLPACNQKIDVVFLLENSNFIMLPDWEPQKLLLRNIINQFGDDARFAVVTFNDQSQVVVLLGQSTDRELLHNQVNQLAPFHDNMP